MFVSLDMRKRLTKAEESLRSAPSKKRRKATEEPPFISSRDSAGAISEADGASQGNSGHRVQEVKGEEQAGRQEGRGGFQAPSATRPTTGGKGLLIRPRQASGSQDEPNSSASSILSKLEGVSEESESPSLSSSSDDSDSGSDSDDDVTF